ncbi:hypothetical protein KGA66_21500 [Actinocrinis puniceicyclus]|uniref:Uncharacterized protein n=1 Tax=Actinocrinis puniceicyclus TaxID=977794 RepID=A0A8J7WNG5_9ACTN|nr:hypothetical protein [Actinocrinis puniceicyclus]MBS2965641.1 hypothetical protein [Actinocrinis puniceicyclus]
MRPLPHAPCAVARHRPRAPEGERGSVTAFVIVMAAAFIAGAGLVIDGGLALAGKTTALDEAQQAARTAATNLARQPLRDGQIVLDPAPALADAQAYITATGDNGTVTLDGTLIHAHIVHRQPTRILALFGLAQITVSANATAQVEAGVSQSTDIGGP